MTGGWFHFWFLAGLCSSWFLAGLIWFVQIVHYPLFDAVGSGVFPRYHQSHSSRTTLVVAVPMLLELFSAVALCLAPQLDVWERIVGLALVVAIWLSTLLLQIPAHNRLSRGPDSAQVRRLTATNWIRTVGWTLRAVLMASVVWRNRVLS